MKHTIELKFEDNSLFALAGFELGESIYRDQVKETLEARGHDDTIEIVIPNQIERIASSFVQGFFTDSINSYGFSEVKRLFSISVKNKKLSADKIWNSLEDI